MTQLFIVLNDVFVHACTVQVNKSQSSGTVRLCNHKYVDLQVDLS